MRVFDEEMYFHWPFLIGELANLATKIITSLLEFLNFVSEVSRLQ
jgi:hypothetical protein